MHHLMSSSQLPSEVGSFMIHCMCKNSEPQHTSAQGGEKALSLGVGALTGLGGGEIFQGIEEEPCMPPTPVAFLPSRIPTAVLPFWSIIWRSSYLRATLASLSTSWGKVVLSVFRMWALMPLCDRHYLRL